MAPLVWAAIRFIIYLAATYQMYQSYKWAIDVIPGTQPLEDPNGEENGWKETYLDPLLEIPGQITGGIGLMAILLLAVAWRRK